jgi:DNA-binding MarR family transcriptional regulator
MRVLGILRDRRLRMADLAAFLGLERSTMSGLVDRAEQRGLLRRERSAADGRVIEVSMTPAGRRIARQAHGQVRRELAAATDRLGAADRRTLTRLLERLLVGGDT